MISYFVKILSVEIFENQIRFSIRFSIEDIEIKSDAYIHIITQISLSNIYIYISFFVFYLFDPLKNIDWRW